MSSVGCPRCEESFRIPDAPLPESVRLRCPWCRETFRLSDLSGRLLPMVELLGEDDQPLSIASLTGQTIGYAGLGAGRETLPSYEPMSRIEPSIDEGDMPSYDDDHGAISFDTDTGASLDQTVVIDKGDVQREASGHEFVDVRDADEAADDLEMQPFDVNVDDVEEYGTGDDRGPVTGPVPARPLGQPAAAGFGDGKLNARPRKAKKKASPILMILGVVGGGLLSMPLADAILVYIFNKPPIVGLWPFNEKPSELAVNSAAAAPAMDVPSNRPIPRSNQGDSLAGDLERMRNEGDYDASLGGTDPADTDPADTDPVDTDSPPPNVTEEVTNSSDMEDLPAADTTAATEPGMPEQPTSDQSPAVSEVASVPTEDASPAPSTARAVEQPNEPSFDDIVADGLGANAKPEASPELPEASPELLEAIDLTDLALQDVLVLPESSDVTVVRRNKSKLYMALANIGNLPQSTSQPETEALLGRVVKSGLMTEMTSAANAWMKMASDKRPHHGILLAGKLLEQDGKWVLQGPKLGDLPLENLDGAGIASGEEVFVIGTIQKADAPATVRVVFIQGQGSN
jgi:hypothetical protein